MRIAKLLIDWRFIEKLNQRDAAVLIGISTSSLCRVEKGIVPDGETLVKLMNWVFGKDADEKATTNTGDQRSDAPNPVLSEGV